MRRTFFSLFSRSTSYSGLSTETVPSSTVPPRCAFSSSSCASVTNCGAFAPAAHGAWSQASCSTPPPIRGVAAAPAAAQPRSGAALLARVGNTCEPRLNTQRQHRASQALCTPNLCHGPAQPPCHIGAPALLLCVAKRGEGVSCWHDPPRALVTRKRNQAVSCCRRTSRALSCAASSQPTA